MDYNLSQLNQYILKGLKKSIKEVLRLINYIQNQNLIGKKIQMNVFKFYHAKNWGFLIIKLN